MFKTGHLRGFLFVTLTLLLFMVGCAALPGAIQQTGSAQQPDATLQRMVTVTGQGEVAAVPDQASLQLGVRTVATTADVALAENSQRMRALLEALEGAGIEGRDIQTSQFSIWPRYDFSDDKSPTLVGYKAANTVSVTVRNLDTLGATLDAVVRAGSNEISGIDFGFSNPEGLLDQARARAMSDARRKAEQLATLAGVELGAVISINESGSGPPPVITRVAAEAAAAAEVPIETGESLVAVSVQVSYELVP
jgi:uncharacterized protein